MSKQFTFKFELGQKVFKITETSVVKRKKCLVCLGKGKITVNVDTLNECTFTCPKCNGSGSLYSHTEKDYRVDTLTIGQQRVEIDRNIEEKYMCKETGVGSGTLYYAERLYTTKEEAEEKIKELQTVVIDDEV